MSLDKYSRNILKPSIIGEISQGSLFNGAVSELYPHHDVLGLVVSARCDIAQRKVPCYFYLPVVRWEDWKNIELPDIFISQLKNEKTKSLKKSLLKLKLSDSIVGRYSSTQISEIIERCDKSSEKKSALSNLEALNDIELFENKKIRLTDLYSKYSGVVKSIFDIIIEYKNPNYYFFESSDKDWYIVRLREIKTLNKDFFFRLAEGIDSPLKDDDLIKNDVVQLPEDGIIMPLYQMQSPYLEHVIQMFVTQFNKIGVEDISITIKNNLNN